jgi:hypothetical protein
MSYKSQLQELKDMLNSMERTLFAARSIIAELSGEKPLMPSDKFIEKQSFSSGMGTSHREEGRIVEGAFDGQGMIDSEGNQYPVPVNYASKSKIVVGDRMKLTITPEGKFIYKQISPTPRKNIIGPLTCEEGQYKVLSGGKEYKILTASITFHKATIGDEVSILLPEEGDAEWGAFDVVIPKVGE